MRKVSIFALLLTLVAALALPAGLVSADHSMASSTIVDVARHDGRLSTFVAALEAADLTDTLANRGPYTVFAPTNEAFEGALQLMGISSAELFEDKDALTEILLYHVVRGEVLAADLADITSTTTVAGYDLNIDTTNGVYLNDTSGVVTADIAASNGVIHVVDNVLFAPNHLAGILVDSTLFTTLLTALDEAELTQILVEEGPYTVFAPTDEAFTASLNAMNLSVDDLRADPALLKSILRYHIVPGTLTAADVLELESIKTLNGASINIAVVDGQVVLNDGQATVTNPDLIGRNGVIHMISGVLVPVVG